MERHLGAAAMNIQSYSHFKCSQLYVPPSFFTLEFPALLCDRFAALPFIIRCYINISILMFHED